MAIINETNSGNLGALDRLNDAFAGLGRRFSDWRLYNRTVEELSQMSVRELDDLGITRGDIRRIAHESVYGL